MTGTTEQLLQQLINLSGPCPSVCDGTKQIGGPEGTSDINIITGLPIEK